MRVIYEAEDHEYEELRGEVRQSLALVGVATLLVVASVVIGSDLLSQRRRRRRVWRRCEPPPAPPPSDSAVWICAVCDSMWRWNSLAEWWEEEV
jgi:hypothetical protein